MALVGQLLFTGIAIGAVYALVALGIALIYRATNVINFAQGELCMLGAYALAIPLASGRVGLFSGGEASYLVGGVIALFSMAVLGLLFALGLYYPLRNRTYLPVVIATIGASIMLQNGALVLFDPVPLEVPRVVDTAGGGFTVGGVFFDSQYLVILVVTVALFAAQHAFLERTLLGKQLQATSQDKDMARLVGIPVTLMIALTFVYSTLLGGVAGMLVAPIYFVTHKMGAVLGLKAFAASIAGGFGDVRGAILGGLTLGLVETFGAAYVSVVYKDAFAFVLLVGFLLLRPHGIFGEKVGEKA